VLANKLSALLSRRSAANSGGWAAVEEVAVERVLNRLVEGVYRSGSQLSRSRLE
jgi:hypothetical protein